MNRSDAPDKQAKPFGINGQREPLLATTPAGDNTASYEQGFPPITMILKSAGGLPPKGQDMNQILYELSALSRWASSGALNSYDHSFSTAISGYPKGAMLLGNDGTTIYINLADANTNDPNTSTTNWLSLAKITSISALAGGADKLPYFTGASTAGQTNLTSVGRDIIGKSSIADILTYLGLGEGSALPVGVPVPWPSVTPPTGWLKCNGAPFSAGEYPELAKVYPALILPDLRGEFIRGWDDGRGVDTGRGLLSWQGASIESHTHRYVGIQYVSSGTVLANTTGNGARGFSGESDAYGGTETRPRNVAFNYIVRAA
ncbi:TPA: tail fiber protein [Citrobacter freundii]|nr:tail fiber protein [Citrobacter freundii]